MLVINQSLAKQFLEVLETYKVSSKSEKGKFHVVKKLSSGKFICSCPSYKECRHIRIVKNNIIGQKYE